MGPGGVGGGSQFEHSARAIIEADGPQDRSIIEARDNADVHWVKPGELEEAAATGTPVAESHGVWMAAERDVVKNLCRQLGKQLDIPKGQLHASAYWFAGRTMTDTDTEKIKRYTKAVESGIDPMQPELLDSIEMLDESLLPPQ